MPQYMVRGGRGWVNASVPELKVCDRAILHVFIPRKSVLLQQQRSCLSGMYGAGSSCHMAGWCRYGRQLIQRALQQIQCQAVPPGVDDSGWY